MHNCSKDSHIKNIFYIWLLILLNNYKYHFNEIAETILIGIISNYIIIAAFICPGLENPRVLTPCRHADLNVKMNGEWGSVLPVFPIIKHLLLSNYLATLTAQIIEK